MLADLHERLAAFSLVLHEDKTRLIEFGRLSTERREARGDRRPETFAFLGFTRCCARSREGRFVVKRRTDGKRLTRKLHTVRTEQRRRMHAPLPDQHRWLCRRGWFRALRRRSPRGGYVGPVQPAARALSPPPCARSPHAGGFRWMIQPTSGGAECGKAARSALWGRSRTA